MLKSSPRPPHYPDSTLFSVSGAAVTLGEMIEKLLEVTMYKIVLRRQMQKVQVEFNLAAHLLVLIGSLHNPYQMEATEQSIF